MRTEGGGFNSATVWLSLVVALGLSSLWSASSIGLWLASLLVVYELFLACSTVQEEEWQRGVGELVALVRHFIVRPTVVKTDNPSISPVNRLLQSTKSLRVKTFPKLPLKKLSSLVHHPPSSLGGISSYAI